MVPGLRFDSQRGDGYVIGPDGRLVAAPTRAVSTLLPFTGSLAAGFAGRCLQPGPLTKLALPLSQTLPKGQWIVSIQSQTTEDATIFLGTDIVPIQKGARAVLSAATTAGPTHEIVVQTPASVPICIQLTVEEPIPTGPARG